MIWLSLPSTILLFIDCFFSCSSISPEIGVEEQAIETVQEPEVVEATEVVQETLVDTTSAVAENEVVIESEAVVAET